MTEQWRCHDRCSRSDSACRPRSRQPVGVAGPTRRADGLGYSTLYVSDHLDAQFEPFIAMTVAAEASVTVRGVLGAVLDHADRHPDRPAVKDLDCALTGVSCAPQLGEWPLACSREGVEPGDRVALLIGNSVDFVVAALGCLWAGVTFVPLAITDPDLRRAQIVADCRPALVITAGSGQTAPSGLPVGTAWTSLSALDVADGPTPPPVPGPISYIIYTSGTTGIPKGVQIPPEAFFHGSPSMRRRRGTHRG